MKLLISFLFFMTVVVVFLALLQFVSSNKKRMEERTKRYLGQGEEQDEEQVEKEKKELRTFNPFYQIQLIKQRVRKLLLSRDKNTKLEVALSRAGIPLKPEEYVLFRWIAALLGAGLAFLLTGTFLFILIGGAAGFFIPRIFLLRKQRKRLNKFNEGLPDMINTVIGALRAGFSFPQALQTVAKEFPSPIKEEIETVLREMQYGNSMENSLNQLKERMPSSDLDMMVEAILIQRNVGGNLATVLEQIVETIRDRMRIKRQIQTLTAQGRMSGIVIGVLPIALGLLLYVVSPEYISSLFSHPLGLVLMAAGVVFGFLGLFLILKITSIEV